MSVVKFARTEAQIQEDLKTLSLFLKTTYSVEVRDKILNLIDSRLSLQGKLVTAMLNYAKGQAISLVLKNLNVAASVSNLTFALWMLCVTEAQLEDESAGRQMNPYRPDKNWNEYVNILVLGWKRGDFRYLPLSSVYPKGFN
ncbi:hypothetical protein [Paludibaculum fermentans]|uniref:hypothetical protein n=1 Tax=Paludibaculum fermentans TaxID=1473598 RepID=UPI003EC06FD2